MQYLSRFRKFSDEEGYSNGTIVVGSSTAFARGLNSHRVKSLKEQIIYLAIARAPVCNSVS